MDATTPKRRRIQKSAAAPAAAKTADQASGAAPSRAYPDLHDHIRTLDHAGLLVKVDRAINKDTEMHPLVRWQFRGGIEEKDRKAFLFTNVTDSKGRRYDIPVAVGALAASPSIYAMGMGRPVDEIGDAWVRAIAHPILPISVTSPPKF